MSQTGVICIGSVLWDVIGRTPVHPGMGGDVAGRIRRQPGGVAMNIAMALAGSGVRPIMLTALGDDDEGRALMSEATRLGIDTSHVTIVPDQRTDCYMAVECGDRGLIAAIADAHTLEAAGAEVLSPLTNGPLGSVAAPFPGVVVLDGNLTEDQLAFVAASPAFAGVDLRVAPASTGKAARLAPLAGIPSVTLYVNLEEAGTLAGRRFVRADDAASALVDMGAGRALVSDGGNDAAFATPGRVLTATPPPVTVERVTGAGDTLMAGHIAAELGGADPESALNAALQAAARHVSAVL